MIKITVLAITCGIFLCSSEALAIGQTERPQTMSGQTNSLEHVLGGDVVITLPSDMKLSQNPNLLKIKEVEQWDYRIRSEPISIALTGLGFRVDKKNINNKIDTRELIASGMARYLPQAAASTVQPTGFENGRIYGHYATLQAKEGEAFRIGYDLPRRCITSALVMAGAYNNMAVSYTITIGSDDCNSEAHKAAIRGVIGMRRL